MQRFNVGHGEFTPIISTVTAEDQFLSVEGGSCRLYTGSNAPTDFMTGHVVTGGYQVIVPAGVKVWACADNGSSVAIVVSDFGL